MTLKLKFQMGQRVYHVLGGRDGVGIVTGLQVRPEQISYLVTWADRDETSCFAIELSEEPVKDFAD